MLRRLSLVLLLLVAGIGWVVTRGASGPAPRRSIPAQWELAHGEVPWAVLPQRTPLAKVPRAPVFERLAVAPVLPNLRVALGSRALAAGLRSQGSENLERVHVRRRVPRMNSDEPPWS